MSYTELLEPILKGGVRSVNFFNGRLLSAEDLKQEQEANREGRSRLGQAVGHGVAYGLDVALSAANTAATHVVTVAPGLAVNREGRALKLSQAADIDPTFIITHTMPLSDAAHGYKIFNDKIDNCEKIVLKA